MGTPIGTEPQNLLPVALYVSEFAIFTFNKYVFYSTAHIQWIQDNIDVGVWYHCDTRQKSEHRVDGCSRHPGQEREKKALSCLSWSASVRCQSVQARGFKKLQRG